MRPLLRAAARTAAVTVGAALALPGAASAGTVVAPGSLTGYGFSQCTAPSQKAMDAWRTSSPYWAVGIYVSGDSRGCVRQPNLSRAWVSTQAARGWRLLPITVGPQAWCTTREPYLHQVRISPRPASRYAAARRQGHAEALKTIRAARALGISARSTLWYDLEGFGAAGPRCRESALWFLSSWTAALHLHRYVSGVYSSAASGLRMVDDARVARRARWHVPDRVWIAEWNGRADTSSSYLRRDGWRPHRRVHQFSGGHEATHGGVTIDIDSDWVDLGRGSTVAREPAHCGGRARYDYPRYGTRKVGSRGATVRTAKCLLRARGVWHGSISGVYTKAFGAAVRRYRVRHGLPARTAMTHAAWVSLLSSGDTPVLKRGSASTAVRRVQRAMNAADAAGLTVSGVFDAPTSAAVRRYQFAHHHARTGVVAAAIWRLLRSGHT